MARVTISASVLMAAGTGLPFFLNIGRGRHSREATASRRSRPLFVSASERIMHSATSLNFGIRFTRSLGHWLLPALVFPVAVRGNAIASARERMIRPAAYGAMDPESAAF